MVCELQQTTTLFVLLLYVASNNTQHVKYLLIYCANGECHLFAIGPQIMLDNR